MKPSHLTVRAQIIVVAVKCHFLMSSVSVSFTGGLRLCRVLQCYRVDVH